MFVLSYMYFTFWNFRHRLVRPSVTNNLPIIAPNVHPIFYPLQVDAKRSAQAEARNAAQMQAGVCNKSCRDFGNVCTKSSRGSCSVAASSPGSGASGGRWFGAAMPPAGRATDYCWLRGVVWVVSFAGLAAARRPCIGAGDSWGTSAPALVFDVQWVAVMVCESVFFLLPRLCLRGPDATEWMTRRGFGPGDMVYCSVQERWLDRHGQEWARVWLAADEACLHHFHWCFILVSFFLQTAWTTIHTHPPIKSPWSYNSQRFPPPSQCQAVESRLPTAFILFIWAEKPRWCRGKPEWDRFKSMFHRGWYNLKCLKRELIVTMCLNWTWTGIDTTWLSSEPWKPSLATFYVRCLERTLRLSC